MKPAAFSYHRPRSLAAALDLLAAHADTAKIIAGGQSLVPLMNMRLAAPATPSQANDTKSCCPGIAVGDIINSPINPVLWESGG